MTLSSEPLSGLDGATSFLWTSVFLYLGKMKQTKQSISNCQKCGLETAPILAPERWPCRWMPLSLREPTCWCNNPKANGSSMEIQDSVYKNKDVPKSVVYSNGYKVAAKMASLCHLREILNINPHPPPHCHSSACPLVWLYLLPKDISPSPGHIQVQGSVLPLPHRLVGALQCSAFSWLWIGCLCPWIWFPL